MGRMKLIMKREIEKLSQEKVRLSSKTLVTEAIRRATLMLIKIGTSKARINKLTMLGRMLGRQRVLQQGSGLLNKRSNHMIAIVHRDVRILQSNRKKQQLLISINTEQRMRVLEEDQSTRKLSTLTNHNSKQTQITFQIWEVGQLKAKSSNLRLQVHHQQINSQQTLTSTLELFKTKLPQGSTLTLATPHLHKIQIRQSNLTLTQLGILSSKTLRKRIFLISWR